MIHVDPRTHSLVRSHGPSAGTRLGAYEILEPIGAGGMGGVYRARDPSLEREVAIKVLPAGVIVGSEREARFEREAKLLRDGEEPEPEQIVVIPDFAAELTARFREAER